MTAIAPVNQYRFFGISDTPFSIAPDPRYLFLSDKHQEALAHLLYGITTEGGFIVLTGEVGTGKTTVCRSILKQVPDKTDVAFIINPRLNATELLMAICDELGVLYNPGEQTNKLLIDVLTEYLLESHARGRHNLLIIDEAQNLSADVLEQIRLLTNLETDHKKLLQLALIGQPELADMLATDELRQLSQRVTARYHLHALTKDETASYIAHRLSVAGFVGPLFTPSALRRIYRATGGVPRLINILCERCMLGAYVQERRSIGATLVKQAAAELEEPELQGGKRSRVRNTPGSWLAMSRLLVIALLLVVAFIAVDYSLQFFSKAGATGEVNVQPELNLPDNGQQERQEQVKRQQGNKQRDALAILADHWGIEATSFDQMCPQALARQLSCHELTLGIAQLKALSLQAIYQSEGEWHFYPGTGELIISPEAQQVTARFLWNRLPNGDHPLPWKKGQQHVGVLDLIKLLNSVQGQQTAQQAVLTQSGKDRGPVLNRFDWLLQQAATLEVPKLALFDESLRQRVAQFQSELGLADSGQVDILTYIALQQLAGQAALTGRGQ